VPLVDRTVLEGLRGEDVVWIATDRILAGVAKHLSGGNRTELLFPEVLVCLDRAAGVVSDLTPAGLRIPGTHPDPTPGEFADLVLVLVSVAKHRKTGFPARPRHRSPPHHGSEFESIYRRSEPSKVSHLDKRS
jgi:hypothetical protein